MKINKVAIGICVLVIIILSVVINQKVLSIANIYENFLGNEDMYDENNFLMPLFIFANIVTLMIGVYAKKSGHTLLILLISLFIQNYLLSFHSFKYVGHFNYIYVFVLVAVMTIRYMSKDMPAGRQID